MPALTPVKRPVELPIVATHVAELDHVPPETVLDNAIEAPEQTVEAPEIVPAVGVVVTVTTLVANAVDGNV